MADSVIQFKDTGKSVNTSMPNGLNGGGKPIKDKAIGGMVTPTGPQMPPNYPSTSHSLHTYVGNYRSSDGSAPGLRDESFWKRTGTAAFQMTLINAFTGLLTMMAFIVTKENGTFNDIQYSLIVGIAFALNLVLSQAIVHYPGVALNTFEIWLEHYSTYVHAPFYRIIYWIALLVARLGGYSAAAVFVWGLQANNAVTHAALPVVAVGLSLWWAFFIIMFGCVVIYWAFLHMYYNPEASSDVNQSNAAWVVGFVAFVVTYITLPYVEGGFEPERYIACSLMSDHWISTGWVFVAAPFSAGAAVSAIWYSIYRTTKIGEPAEKSE